MASRSGGRRAQRRWVMVAVAVMVATLTGLLPGEPGEAHTCTPDAVIGVSGRLVLPRGSSVAIVDLPERTTRIVPVLPLQGAATGVAVAPDGSMLAVSRFWRPPDQLVGGQDILIVGSDGGEPVATIDRGRAGDVLGTPSWLPDGSLVYERRTLSGANEAVRIERVRPGEPGQVLADGVASPGVSADSSLLAMVRFSDRDRLSIRPIAGGAESMLVDRPNLLAITFPRFSPDGAWIAFTAASDPGALMPAPGPTLSSIAAARLPLPGASLLGPMIARAHGIPWDVWVVRPDGSELHRVTAFSDDDSSVAWSPDSRWLVTLSSEALHVVSLDSSANYCIGTEGGYGALEWRA